MSLHGFDLAHWVTTLGYFGVLLIIFLETGLFFGFFLPGDSLLFTAGFLASQKIFNIWYLIPAMMVTAILGYQVGYWFGKRLGGWLMGRKESFWFKHKHIETAKSFYDSHGRKAVVLGRLLPIVRTFVPIVAGMVHMDSRRYLILNILGALLWAGGVTLLGFTLGKTVPQASHYIIPVIFIIIFLSLTPALWRYFYNRVIKR